MTHFGVTPASRVVEAHFSAASAMNTPLLPRSAKPLLYSRLSQPMRTRCTACVSVFLTGQISCTCLVILLQASILAAQTAWTPEALLKEAESLHRAGKLGQAIDDYRLFLAQHPDVSQVRSDLGAALAGAGRYEEAIAEYQRALKLQDGPQIRLNLALAYYKADNPALAAKDLEKVRAAMPNDLRVDMLLADCHLRLGENKKVIELLDSLEPPHGDYLATI